MHFELSFGIFIGIVILELKMISANASTSLYSIPPLFKNIKNVLNMGTEKSTIAIDFNEITSQILIIRKSFLIREKFRIDEDNDFDEKWQFEKCREMGIAIGWSILWELELLKMENASIILEEENKSSKVSENYKQIEENVGKFYSEIKKSANFDICKKELSKFWLTLKNDGFNDDFGQLPIIFKMIEKLNMIDEDWKPLKMEEFMIEFMDKYKFEFELIKEFTEFKLNKTLLKADWTKQGEELSTANQMHQLIVKLNGLNDVKKIGEISILLVENVKKIDRKFNEWIKFQKKGNMDENNEKSITNNKTEYHEKVGKVIKSAIWKSESLEHYIKKFEMEKENYMKEYYEKQIYEILLNIANLINLVRWNENRIMPERTDEVEVVMMHTEIQQLILKLASLRRFVLSKRNEKKNGKADKENKDLKQFVDIELEQKLKWILRRQQRIQDQMEREKREDFRIKLTTIFTKISKELEKSTGCVSHSTFGHIIRKPMRQFYYGNEVRKKLKIRRSKLHIFVTLGNEYEYDYLDKPNPSRRTIFKKWKDAEFEENDDRKAQKMKEFLPKFNVVEADEIFFNMPSKGWTPGNYAPERMRKCLSYAYEFVCELNEGKCPSKEQWPEPYKWVDNRAATNELVRNGSTYTNISVFSEEYANTYHRDFKRKMGDDNGKKCIIKELEIQIRMVKGERWDDKIQQHEKKLEGDDGDGDENTNKTKQMLLPAIVVYDTGRFDDFKFDTDRRQNCPFKFKEPLEIQEYLVKETETPHAILYSALLKVNVCIVDGVPRAFVNNFYILDSEMKNVIYAFGGVNLYEEDERGHHLFNFVFDENKQMSSSELCEYNL